MPGFWKSRHPHPNKPPKELPKAGPARHALRSHPHGPGPCRSLEGMCLLGPRPALTEARTRASPCPSLPPRHTGFIVGLCHGNYALGRPVHMASAEKIAGPSRSAKTRGPEPPKQASYVKPGSSDRYLPQEGLSGGALQSLPSPSPSHLPLPPQGSGEFSSAGQAHAALYGSFLLRTNLIPLSRILLSPGSPTDPPLAHPLLLGCSPQSQQDTSSLTLPSPFLTYAVC